MKASVEITLEEKHNEDTIILIDIEGRRRSWKNIKKVLDSDPRTRIDWRKCNTAFWLSCSCGEKYVIKNCKDFPLEDVQCDCGVYFVKWKTP